MSELSDLQSQQIGFESERVGADGDLFSHNGNPEFAVPRMIEEAHELIDAIKNGETPMAQMEELADVLIFAASIGAHLSVQHGLPVTTLSEIIAMKMKKNEEKYKVEHFAKRTVKEGLIYSREVWKKDESPSQNTAQ